MSAVPTATPVTIPEDEPIVATEVLPLVQLPPDAVSFNVVVVPTQAVGVPVIAPGDRFTVIVFVATAVIQERGAE